MTEHGDLKWDHRFLDLTAAIGSWSKDPSTKVGAVVARPDRTIAAVGYNGFARGVRDDAERYADRTTKYAMVVHAEANALVSAREPLHGYTLYVAPLFPCSACASLIIQAGIARVVSDELQGEAVERWKDSLELSRTMFAEAGVKFELV